MESRTQFALLLTIESSHVNLSASVLPVLIAFTRKLLDHLNEATFLW